MSALPVKLPPEQKTLTSIVEDPWLSVFLNKKSYRIECGSILQEFTLPHELKDESFAYIKVPTRQLEKCRFLESLDFKLVDTLITFQKEIKSVSFSSRIRWAEAGDEAAVENIARHNFIYSRFHQDENVKKEVADEIKAQWALNYFRGVRGNRLLVAVEDGQVAGFTLVVDDQDRVVVDLIAVDSSFQGRGLSRDMIQFLEAHSGNQKFMEVGTQVSNIPSIRLYETSGFVAKSSNYVFHYHS